MDGQTTVTTVQPNSLSNILVKQSQPGKTISLLRPGLLQTKVGSGAAPRSSAATTSALPVGLAPGQIALISSETSSTGTVVHQAVQISQAGNGIKHGEQRSQAPGVIKPQSSLLYIVPTTTASAKPSLNSDVTSSHRASTIPSHSILGPIKKTPATHSSPTDFIPNLETFGITKFNINDVKSIEELVKYTVKIFPLVSQSPDKHAHPYCAPGYTEFLKWNIAKQRAAEWTRACAVRKAILFLMNKHKYGDSFNGERVWSRRQIVTWCRKQCFTPLLVSRNYSTRDSSCGFTTKRLKSVTDHKDLVTKLEDMRDSSAKQCSDDSDVEDIEIVVEKSAAKQMQKKVKEEPEAHPGTSTGNSNPNVVGDILMRVTHNFVEDLIRGAAANMYDEGFSSMEIGAIDLYNFIKNGNVCDFLTNNHMGINVD